MKYILFLNTVIIVPISTLKGIKMGFFKGLLFQNSFIDIENLNAAKKYMNII